MEPARAMTAEIDRNSPEPFYLQLTRRIEGAIDRGDFAAGSRLPSESELCRRFDLARSTVRETLRTLEDRGRIKLVPRRGAFVIDPQDRGWVLQVAEGFFEGETGQKQRKVETAVLDAAVKPLPDEAVQALGLPKGAEGFVLRRLRKLDGKLALYSVNYLPAGLAPVVGGSSALAPQGSLNRVLHEAGYRIAGARRSVEAVPAPSSIAKLLRLKPGRRCCW